MNQKILKNALLTEKLIKLTSEERRDALKELLDKGNTQRGLAKELGIPYATLHDWVSDRQNNTGKYIHISFTTFHRRLKSLDPTEITDWGRLEMIKEDLDRLLRKKK